MQFQYNLNTIDWTTISTIVSILALLINLIIAYSLVISIRALKEAQNSKDSAILIWALDKMNATRPIMLEVIKNKDKIDWKQTNRTMILEMIATLQMICYFALEGIINKERIADIWGKGIIEQWSCLESFIQDFRNEIGEPNRTSDGAYYARSFEEFSVFTKKYLGKKFKLDWLYIQRQE